MFLVLQIISSLWQDFKDELQGCAIMGNSLVHLYDKDKLLIVVCKKKDWLYLLDAKAQCIETQETALSTWAEWHWHFRHVGVSSLKRMHAKRLVDSFDVDENSPMPDCEAFQAKQTCAPFPRHAVNHTRTPGELTHTNLWESHMIGSGGLKYFMSFMDDCTRYITVKFLQTKGQAAKQLKAYVAYLEHQYDFKPKVFQADNSGRYVSNNLVSWCESKGINLNYTAPYSPEKNGIAERMNRTLVELVQARSIAQHIPSYLWPEATKHTAYLRNWSHTWVLDASLPLEAWSGEWPNVSHLHEFGTPVWALVEGQNISKLDPKAVRYYNKKTHQVYVSHNFQFTEKEIMTHLLGNSHEPLMPSTLSKGEPSQNTLSDPQTDTINKTDCQNKNTGVDLKRKWTKEEVIQDTPR